ncbi:MAG: DUF4912 domain-containing protein [Thermoguttaceae bacterium]|nr:DUF4912 domain-containing protein [Thermoguttaceae bacterium]
MYYVSELRKMTVQELTPIAHEYGITRVHSLRKADLLNKVIQKLDEANALAPEPFTQQMPRAPQTPPVPQAVNDLQGLNDSMRVFTERASHSLKKTEASVAKVAAAQQDNVPRLYSIRSKPNDLAYLPDAYSDIPDDSFVLDMIDPYWLHATWCLRRKTIERAKVALGQYWYTAKPMLRLTVLSDGDSGTGGRFQLLRDVLIHGHVNHWFLPVSKPPATYLAEIGYYSPEQKKFCGLLKSNVISTPHARNALRYEQSAEVAWMTVCGLQPAKLPPWSPKNHNLYKKWAEKTNQPLAADSTALKVDTPTMATDELPLRVTTELVLYGSTTPDSQVTMNQEWVATQPDGTFMMRIEVPEQGRQMMQIDSKNRFGKQTMVLTVERTTQIVEESEEKE